MNEARESVAPPFHLAFPVDDLEAARAFYADLLGCPVGREDERWIDFDFFGHQITAHLVEERGRAVAGRNAVDGARVPVPHFGVVLERAVWRELRALLEARGVDFLIAPHERFAGRAGAQGTFFIADPSGNVLEFKCFDDEAMLFARD